MPLTLDCVCPGANIAVCVLTSLTFEVLIDESFFGLPAIAANHTLTLYADKSDPTAPTISMINPGSGSFSFDLPLADWVPRWESYSVELVTGSSLYQVPSPAFSAYDKFWAGYSIAQAYTCTNPANPAGTTFPSASAYTSDPGDDTKCEPATADLRVVCYAGQGVGSIFYKSTIFSTCSGCTITDKQFKPAVTSEAKVDISSGNWCLCASGGSGRYSYALAKGILPCGMSLDGTTGCITGIPNGECAGTPLFTFTVLDFGTKETAFVVCGVLGTKCSGGAFGNQAY